MSPPLVIDDTQALYFRARRGHLAGSGADDAPAAARAILGAQAQQQSAALLALSARTAGRPSARSLKTMLLDSPRRLVRLWGQRDTLHIYDPNADWATIISARSDFLRGLALVWATTERV